MERALENLKPHELKILFGIIEKLSGGQDHMVFRNEISKDLLHLLKADFFASFIWNPSTNSFGDPVLLNMCPANVARYKIHFQFHDPITHLLQKRRQATLVCEVMAQKELEKTEFFNDFLMKDGLHHGVNLYAYDGDLNIGDLRIWRSGNRPDFDRRDVAILDFILPYFRNALRNARHLAKARSMAGLWDGFFINTQIALFLFDQNNRLIFQNKRVDALILPTTPLPAAKIGEDVKTDLNGKKVNTFLTFIRDCDPISVVGYPAITVPAGYSSKGLPIGLQMVARPFEEGKLLQMGHAFEQATNVRTPPKL
jgi:amidase